MVAVLLAAYNGEKYIEEQLRSVLSQSWQDFVLYIQDDGSEDETVDILRRYERLYPDKIVVRENEKNSGSPGENFFLMMRRHTDDYTMLCDQDDIWLADKIEITLACMQAAEKMYGNTTPILVHTDLWVADENGKTTGKLYSKTVGADYTRTRLNELVGQNNVTGCTVLYNAALAKLLQIQPPFFVMHDWWLALTAAAFGKIIPLQQGTMLYRQHGDNAIGVRNPRSPAYLLRRLFSYKEYQKELAASYRQAESFLTVFAEKLDDGQKELLWQYSQIPKLGAVKRRWAPFRLKTTKKGVFKKIAGFIFG